MAGRSLRTLCALGVAGTLALAACGSAVRPSASTPASAPVVSTSVPLESWPALRVGVLYVEGAAPGASAYVAIVRVARRLPGDASGGFWLGGPRQMASGHERRAPRQGRRGVCYVAYFYSDEQGTRPDPVIFPPASNELAFGYRTRGRTYGGAPVRLTTASDGLGGGTQATLSKRVGCR